MIFRKTLDKESVDDDYSEDLFIQSANLFSVDEYISAFDRDLLSGRELLDIDGGLNDDYICLDNFIASQVISY